MKSDKFYNVNLHILDAVLKRKMTPQRREASELVRFTDEELVGEVI